MKRAVCLVLLSLCFSALAPAKEIVVQKRYLNVPVSNKGRVCSMVLGIDGEDLGHFGLRIATGEPDWWAFFDVARFQGKKLSIEINGQTKDDLPIAQDNAIKGAENLYREKYRPQFHFTSRRRWLNDPNGLVYYDGQWHMYYQHNPVGTAWGNMTWGHAVSQDLVRWKELPKVLFPDPKTGACFSGAAFVDRENLLGRKTGEEDVLVAFYLRTKSGLCLAYSNDRGRTLTDYEGNPVLTNPGARIDTPRPFWYEPTGRWIAPTYDHFKDESGRRLRAVGFYSSANLTDWKFESRVEQDKWGDELCGCADFFQLPLDGDPDNQKWVLVLIDNSYIVGTFDGHTFCTLAGKPASTADRVRSLVPEFPVANFYATQSWHNAPDDRRVQITWMRGGKYPGMPFSQQMTFPCALTLHSTGEGPRMRMNPIPEIETLRTKTHEWKNLTLKPGDNPLSGLKGDLFDVEVEFVPAAGAEVEFDLRGTRVTYRSENQTLSCGKMQVPLKPVEDRIRLRILLDRTSVEVFGNDGRVCLPLCIVPPDDNHSLIATSAQGAVTVNHLRVHELKSAWE